MNTETMTTADLIYAAQNRRSDWSDRDVALTDLAARAENGDAEAREALGWFRV